MVPPVGETEEIPRLRLTRSPERPSGVTGRDTLDRPTDAGPGSPRSTTRLSRRSKYRGRGRVDETRVTTGTLHPDPGTVRPLSDHREQGTMGERVCRYDRSLWYDSRPSPLPTLRRCVPRGTSGWTPVDQPPSDLRAPRTSTLKTRTDPRDFPLRPVGPTVSGPFLYPHCTLHGPPSTVHTCTTCAFVPPPVHRSA